MDFNPNNLNISFGNANVVHNGRLRVLNLPKARRILQHKEYTIDVVIGKGRGRAQCVTSDLTTKYVLINSSYS